MGGGYGECVLSHGRLICVSRAQGSSLWFLPLFIRNIILCSSAAGSSRGLCWIMHIHSHQTKPSVQFFSPIHCASRSSLDCPSRYLCGNVAACEIHPCVFTSAKLEHSSNQVVGKAQEDRYTGLHIYIKSDFRYSTTGTTERAAILRNVCAATKPLFNHNFSKMFCCNVLIHNITMKQIIIDLLLFSHWLKYSWKHKLGKRLLNYCLKKIFAILTKVSRDEDVICTTLASGVIMRVVWGQHSSLWIGEVTSTGSWWDRRKNK